MADGMAMRGREADKFAAARRHSRLVRRLRWLLPVVVASGSLTFIAYTAARSWVPNISIGSIALQGTSVIMSKPHLSGFDANRRPYDLVAERFISNITTPKKIGLEMMNARLEMAANGWARVTADTGLYDGDADTFHAEKNVHVISSLGYEAFMKDADVDVKQNTIDTQQPVEVRNGDNRIFADRMRSTGGGEVIVFDGHVHVLLVPTGEQR